MNAQFTIRLDDTTNKRTIEQAQALGQTRAELVRNAITSYVTNPNPKEDSKEIIDLLKQQLEIANQQLQDANASRSRTDTIIMQLTQQLQDSQLLLEDVRHKPKSLWKKLRAAFS